MTKGIFRSALYRYLVEGRYEDIDTVPMMGTVVRTDLYKASLYDVVIADVPEDARMQTVQLTGVRVANGAIYADDITFRDVGREGEPLEVEFVFWQDTGDAKTSILFCYLGKDEEAFGFGTISEHLPLIANGGDITICFGNGPFVVFSDWG